MFMSDVTIRKVYDELKALRNVVEDMRQDIQDRFLTPDEEHLVEKALQEKKEGKTVSLDKLKEEI